MIRSTGMFNESCGNIRIRSEIVKPELSRGVAEFGEEDDDACGMDEDGRRYGRPNEILSRFLSCPSSICFGRRISRSLVKVLVIKSMRLSGPPLSQLPSVKNSFRTFIQRSNFSIGRVRVGLYSGSYSTTTPGVELSTSVAMPDSVSWHVDATNRAQNVTQNSRTNVFIMNDSLRGENRYEKFNP